MSQLTDLYENTNKPRPSDARQIPGQKTDFFDRQHNFADGFTPEIRRGLAGSEQFTDRGLKYYDEELNTMVIPESFIRSLPDVPLNRWSPTTPFYTPGNPQS